MAKIGTGGFGYYTNGLPILSGTDLNSTSDVSGTTPGIALIPVDTGAVQGGAPQTGAIIPGTLPAPSDQIGLTAQADGTKANATQLGYGLNTVTTVAGANDSVLLPYAFPGAVLVVINTVATAAQVFGKGTDTIDGVATATGIEVAASSRNTFYGVAGAGNGSDAGAWLSAGAAVA